MNKETVNAINGMAALGVSCAAAAAALSDMGRAFTDTKFQADIKSVRKQIAKSLRISAKMVREEILMKYNRFREVRDFAQKIS